MFQLAFHRPECYQLTQKEASKFDLQCSANNNNNCQMTNKPQSVCIIHSQGQSIVYM